MTEEGATGPVAPGDAGQASPTDLAASRDLSVTHATDTRRGAVSSTGRQQDVALVSRGFFVVQDSEGNEFFTRDGQLPPRRRRASWWPPACVVQGTGGPIEVAVGSPWRCRTTGWCWWTAPRAAASRSWTSPTPPAWCTRDGNGLPGGQRPSPPTAAAEVTTVMQGHLEGSNVDPVRTLVDMIAAQRAFEVESKVLQATDEMLGKSVNTLSAGLRKA